MNAETMKRIGRLLKATCPPGTGFATIIGGSYLSSCVRVDVQRMLARWLVDGLRAACPSAIVHGRSPGESEADFACRRLLEGECAAMAETLAATFADYGHHLTIAFFLFELNREPSRMAYRFIGDGALALSWVSAIATLRTN